MFQCNEDLENERTRLLTRIAELDQILKSSDNEKDQVVKGLREQVEYTQRELVARDNLVRTLSEESRVLQKQLLDVAQQCQELARKLNEQGTSAEKVTKETLQKVIKTRLDLPHTHLCSLLGIYTQPWQQQQQ